MNPGMKMLVLSSRDEKRSGGGRSDNQRDRRGGVRNEMDYGRYNYDEMDNRMGGYAMEDIYEPEDRRGGRRYSRDRRGRFSPRSEFTGEWTDGGYGGMDGHYPMTPYVPPIHQNEYRADDEHEDNQSRRINRIGFDANRNEMRTPQEMAQEYRSMVDHRIMDETMSGNGSSYMKGHGAAMGIVPFNEQMAMEWTKAMQNEDGTKGPHWTMDQVKSLITQKGIDCDPVTFWAVINAIYSDDVAVAKKHNVNTIDYYIDRAKAWLRDKDAVKDKAAAYYTYVVQH